jgi:hypothetical protein
MGALEKTQKDAGKYMYFARVALGSLAAVLLSSLALADGGTEKPAVGFGFTPPANMENRDLFVSLSCDRNVTAMCGAIGMQHQESGSSFGVGSVELRVTGSEGGIIGTGRKVAVDFPGSNPEVPEYQYINDFGEFGGGFPFVNEFPNEYDMTVNEIGKGTAELDTQVLGSILEVRYTYRGTAVEPFRCMDGSTGTETDVRVQCSGDAF